MGIAGVNEEEGGSHGRGGDVDGETFRGGCWKVPVVIMGVGGRNREESRSLG